MRSPPRLGWVVRRCSPRPGELAQSACRGRCNRRRSFAAERGVPEHEVVDAFESPRHVECDVVDSAAGHDEADERGRTPQAHVDGGVVVDEFAAPREAQRQRRRRGTLCAAEKPAHGVEPGAGGRQVRGDRVRVEREEDVGTVRGADQGEGRLVDDGQPAEGFERDALDGGGQSDGRLPARRRDVFKVDVRPGGQRRVEQRAARVHGDCRRLCRPHDPERQHHCQRHRLTLAHSPSFRRRRGVSH
jgi:hypothetical protein